MVTLFASLLKLGTATSIYPAIQTNAFAVASLSLLSILVLIKMNNDKMNYYALESANGKGIADGGDINFKVNMSDYGRFLVLFIINHTGANTISSATGFWQFSITDPNGNEVTVNDRKVTCLTIPHVWDASASTLAQIYINNTGQHTFKAENKTGTTTSPQYSSTFSVRIYRLKAG